MKSGETSVGSSSGVRNVRSRPALRESERTLDAGAAGANGGAGVRNVGVAQSVLEALKGFMGLRGAEVSSAQPLYLPREGGETGALPLEAMGETAAEDKPIGLPAFLQRPRD